MSFLYGNLHVAIIDKDAAAAEMLRTAVQEVEGVLRVKCYFDVPDDIEYLYVHDEINCVFIDLFTVGVVPGLSFLELFRSRYWHIPVTLYSLEDHLKRLPGIPSAWQDRFGHYFKVPKEAPAKQFKEQVNIALKASSMYELYRVTALKADHAKEKARNLPAEAAREISEVLDDSRRALEEKARVLINMKLIQPWFRGFETFENATPRATVQEVAIGQDHLEERVKLLESGWEALRDRIGRLESRLSGARSTIALLGGILGTVLTLLVTFQLYTINKVEGTIEVLHSIRTSVAIIQERIDRLKGNLNEGGR
jgi:hypothetical protein